MLRIIALALVAFLGVTPVTDDLLRALSERVSILEREAVRGRKLRDAHDADRLLGPRSLSTPIGVRGMSSGGIPDLATPLLSRLRDDSTLPGLAGGRADGGYPNQLVDPLFETFAYLGTALTTSYVQHGPNWEAKYALVSGTAPSTRDLEPNGPRGQSGTSYGYEHSQLVSLDLSFASAGSITVYLRETTDHLPFETFLPSWLTASGWFGVATAGTDITATGKVQIVDGSDNLLAESDEVDLVTLGDIAEAAEASAAYEGLVAYDPYRIRFAITVTATAAAGTILTIGNPLLAYSDDGSPPLFSPSVGFQWLPGSPGRQLVTRSFVASNVAAGATVALDVSAAGFPSQVPEVYDGSIVGITYRWTANITGGSHSLRVLKNGSVVWTAFSGASAREDAISQPPWVDTFEALDTITVEVVTGGGFLPAGTNDIVVELYLLLDFDAR